MMWNMIKFNKATATEIMYREYVKALVDATNKKTKAPQKRGRPKKVK